MHQKKILLKAVILAGAAVTVSAVVLPFVTLPTGESAGLLDLNQGFGVALILLSLLAAILGVTKLAKFAWVPSLASLGVAGFGISAAFARIESAQQEIQSLIESSPFGALASNLLGEFEIHNSWILLFIGSALSILGSLMLLVWKDQGHKTKTRTK